MTISKKLSFIFLIVFFPNILHAQAQDSAALVLESNKLRQAGAILTRDGKHTTKPWRLLNNT